MHYIAIFVLLVAYVWADESQYSFSQSVGSGSGTSYSITGDERISAIRVWEVYQGYVYGLQVRYGSVWSNIAGFTYGTPMELELFRDERIIQVSGKYSHYIQSLIFVTSKGRSLLVGQPSGHSFNMYPSHPDAELRFISGRYHGGLTSFQAHWAILDDRRDW